MKPGHAAALTLVVALAGAACGEDTVRGQIVVGFASNMPIPKDISHLSLQVKQEGVVKYDNLVELGKNREPLPTSVTLVRGKRAGDQVSIKVAGWQGAKLRIVRQVITTVPANRIALLTIDLQWFCDGQVKPYQRPLNGTIESDEVSSSCDEGETCIDGECVDAKIPEKDLPDYQYEDLYGPANDDGDCFAVERCFAAPSQVLVRASDCSVDAPQGGQGINVAIETNDGQGFCTENNRCFVPLDGFSRYGWTQTSDNRLRLNPGACDADNPSIKGVAVTTTCATKTISVPTCPPP